MMKTSEHIDQISTALAAAQGEFPQLEKNRDNPFFKSKYADLSDILTTCRPTLSKHGLALLQPISIDNGRVVITTRLVHKSGQWFEDSLSMRPDKDSPQAIGSAATYGRRYGAEAMLGVAASIDDDGNVASGNIEKAKEDKVNPPKAILVKSEPIKKVYKGTPEQKEWLHELLQEYGIPKANMASFHQTAIDMSFPDIQVMIERVSKL